MGHALDTVLDLANDLTGHVTWGPHPKANAFIELEMHLPGEPDICEGAGPTVDEAAMNLLLVYFPDRVRVDLHLAALAGEHAEAA